MTTKEQASLDLAVRAIAEAELAAALAGPRRSHEMDVNITRRMLIVQRLAESEERD